MTLTIFRCRRTVTENSQGHFDFITSEYKKANGLSHQNYDVQEDVTLELDQDILRFYFIKTKKGEGQGEYVTFSTMINKETGEV